MSDAGKALRNALNDADTENRNLRDCLERFRYAKSRIGSDSWDDNRETRGILERAAAWSDMTFGPLSSNDIGLIAKRIGEPPSSLMPPSYLGTALAERDALRTLVEEIDGRAQEAEQGVNATADWWDALRDIRALCAKELK